jgi:hypothetical protein
MRDELKKQWQHKNETMAKEKNTREDKRREFKPTLSMEVSILEVFTNYFYYL